MYSGNHSPVHPLDTLLEAAEKYQNDPGIGSCFVVAAVNGGRFSKGSQFEMSMAARKIPFPISFACHINPWTNWPDRFRPLICMLSS